MAGLVAVTNVRTVVEFVPGSEPIRGHVTHDAARDQPFVGWLALLGLLERALASATEDDQRQPQAERP